MERWCCWASTSVGASSAAWPPESTTRSIARSATTVLPEPTSPWSSRCIGCPAARSARISSPTARWPAVSVNGSRASKGSSSPPSRPVRGRRGPAAAPARRWASTAWVTKASSNRAASPRRAFWPRVRPVDPLERLPGAEQAALLAHPLGQRLGHLVEHRQRELDGVLELPRTAPSEVAG